MGVYMDEIRQSPEHFLKEIEKEKQNLNRGHLKIFFGYAAGVGKTYADWNVFRILFRNITELLFQNLIWTLHLPDIHS